MSDRSKATPAGLPAIGCIYIDNFDELTNSRDNPAISKAVSTINEFIKEYGGVLWRTEPGRFKFIIEQPDLNRVLKYRFPLLDRVREIQTPSAMPITLSIAVGLSETLQEADESSHRAMELAQGRGGDQAVIKQGRDFKFYGGKRQPGERYSRVKSRVVAHALSQLMHSYDNIFIMGHRMADYDSLGSCLGIAACAMALKSDIGNVHVVIEQDNEMISSLMSDAASHECYANLFFSPEDALQICDANSLTIVLDTQIASAAAAPALLEKTGAIAVIDHHRRGVSAISHCALQFVQVYASSTSELVCEILQYFSPEPKLTPLLSSALLSGIMVDTKHFSYNTGVRTFEASAFLRKHGADTNYVKELFQDDAQQYLDRAEIIRRAEYVLPNVVVSDCESLTGNSVLLAAQAADTLINLRGIHAAFVLAKTEQGVHVSARSSGEINVQIILESMGGGGHLHVAGAQFPQKTLEYVKGVLLTAIDNYFTEPELEHVFTGS